MVFGPGTQLPGPKNFLNKSEFVEQPMDKSKNRVYNGYK